MVTNATLFRKVYTMSKLTFAGLVSCFFSALLFGYQALQAFMKSGINASGEMVWKNLTLINVIDKSHFSWVNGMSEGAVHNSVQYVIAMPLYLLLFCVGILLFILGRLTSKV